MLSSVNSPAFSEAPFFNNIDFRLIFQVGRLPSFSLLRGTGQFCKVTSKADFSNPPCKLTQVVTGEH